MAAHLGVASDPLDELDRDLADDQTCPQRPRDQICLEDVAGGPHFVQGDLLQRRTPEQPESGSRIADRDAQQHPHVQVAPAGQDLASQWPVDDRATGHPTRADDQVRAAERGEEAVELLGLMRAVSVHLSDDVVAGGESPVEAGEVGGAQTGFHCSMQDVDSRIRGSQLVRDSAGAVRRSVIDDQDVDLRLGRAQAP